MSPGPKGDPDEGLFSGLLLIYALSVIRPTPVDDKWISGQVLVREILGTGSRSDYDLVDENGRVRVDRAVDPTSPGQLGLSNFNHIKWLIRGILEERGVISRSIPRARPTTTRISTAKPSACIESRATSAARIESTARRSTALRLRHVHHLQRGHCRRIEIARPVPHRLVSRPGRILDPLHALTHIRSYTSSQFAG